MSTEPACIYRAFETVNPTVCDKLARMSIQDFLKFWDPNELNEEGKPETARVQYGIITRYCQAQQSANYNLPFSNVVAKREQNLQELIQ